MAALRDIPITLLSVPQGSTEATIVLPDSNLSGQWSRVVITITNNYLNETYPLTNSDIVFELSLSLKKGSTIVTGVYAPFNGGQVISAKTGLPVPRAVYINRPSVASGDPVSGAIKVSGEIKIYTDLEIGAAVEYF